MIARAIDILAHRRALALLVTNGQNPMLAYAGIRGLLKSLSLAWAVHLLTRRGILWRS